MLKPEHAKARLAEWRMPEGENRVHEEIKRLPTTLRELGELVFGLRETEESALDGGWQRHQQKRVQAAAELDRCSTAERIKVFAAVAPQLAETIEQTWQLLKTTPYQSNGERKAFRAPQSPELVAGNLCSWASSMAVLGSCYRSDVLTPSWLAAWAPHLDEGYRFFGSGWVRCW